MTEPAKFPIDQYNFPMVLGLLLALYFVAPTVFYLGLSTSFMVGTMGVITTWLALYGILLIGQPLHMNRPFFYIFLAVLGFMIFHMIAAFFLFMYESNLFRGVNSLLLLAVFSIGAFCFSSALKKLTNDQVDRLMKIVFGIFLIVFLMFFIKPIQQMYPKSIIPYTEVSHYALFVIATIYYFAVRYPKYRIPVLLFGLLQALLLSNLTLMVSIVVLSFVLFRFYIAIIAAAVASAVFYWVDLTYFADRISNISTDSTNISTLVFVQGWELAWESLKKSYGLGIGLQQLGHIEVKTESSNIIYWLTKGEFNISDAGLTSPKIISEFGIFGVIAVLLYLFFWIKGVLFLRNFHKTNAGNVQLLVFCFFVSYFSELFVRGVGYFVGTAFFALSALYYILIYFPREKSTLQNSQTIKLAEE